MPQDRSLQLNQSIEAAILQLQQSPTPEQLAHTLTVVRRCMQAGGQWIVAVEPVPGGGQVQPRVVTTADDGQRVGQLLRGRGLLQLQNGSFDGLIQL